MPDNEPLASYELFDNGIKLLQNPEPWTQMQKSMELRFESDGGIRVINSITNLGAWPVEMSVWSLTIGSRSGREVLPRRPAQYGTANKHRLQKLALFTHG